MDFMYQPGVLLRRVAHFLVYRQGPTAKMLYRLSRIVSDCYENNITYPDINGEYYIIRKLGNHGIKFIFDVGANMGDYSVFATSTLPKSKIYAFEVCESIYKKMKLSIEHCSNIHAVNLGLSNIECDVHVEYFPKAEMCTNIVGEKYFYSNTLGAIMSSTPSVRVAGKVTTGDKFCREHNIDQIDLVKIDVEGAEFAVLDGFSQMLTNRRIRVLQIEYGLANISSGFLLKNLYEHLGSKGYVVGKIHKKHVDFGDYLPTMENFRTCNFLAVRNDEAKIIDDLSG